MSMFKWRKSPDSHMEVLVDPNALHFVEEGRSR
jgi:hypothetical protein